MSGCIIDGEPTYRIQTGAGLAYRAGQDAGFYLQYMSGGMWRVDWTCDTALSAQGCDFKGFITANSGNITNVLGYDCSASLNTCNVMPVTAAATQLQFDQPVAGSDEYKYVTFNANPGASVNFDLFLDGLHHPELTFYPYYATATVGSVPFNMVPTTP
jgi:hypothetical protein